MLTGFGGHMVVDERFRFTLDAVGYRNGMAYYHLSRNEPTPALPDGEYQLVWLGEDGSTIRRYRLSLSWPEATTMKLVLPIVNGSTTGTSEW